MEARATANGISFFGEDGWAALPEHYRKILYDLCANHTRNLHIDAANRLYSLWLKEQLGENIVAAVEASGGKARLETDGPALLRVP